MAPHCGMCSVIATRGVGVWGEKDLCYDLGMTSLIDRVHSAEIVANHEIF